MNRRELIMLLGGAATSSLAWPRSVRAQQPAMPVVGFLSNVSPDLDAFAVQAFKQGLSEAGYVEGRNVAIEYRGGDGGYARLPDLAADLVRRQVAVIATSGGIPAALAAKAATGTIPIVFFMGGDPVALGLVASLNKPGGNLTGVTTLGTELGQKRLELARDLLPSATTMALLINPTLPIAERQSKDLQAAARALGLQLHVLQASTDRDIETAFATLTELQARALVVSPDGFFNSRSKQIAALSVRHSVPAIYQYQPFTAAGGLMSYGASLTDSFRLTGIYSGRILKGEKPGDLPVQQATKVELIINLKTAKALGLEVPPTLLTRADEVIE